MLALQDKIHYVQQSEKAQRKFESQLISCFLFVLSLCCWSVSDLDFDLTVFASLATLERERESVCVCVCVCVRKRERERERERERACDEDMGQPQILDICVMIMFSGCGLCY